LLTILISMLVGGTSLISVLGLDKAPKILYSDSVIRENK